MFVNLLAFLTLFGLIAFFGWLTRRAWTLSLPLLKWPVTILTGLATALILTVAGIGLVGFVKTIFQASNPVKDVTIKGTPEQIARGQSLAGFCAVCHASQEESKLLDGNDRNLLDIPNGPVAGEVYAPNLTRGGEIKDWTDGEVIRAIREGVHRNTRPLLLMPSEYFIHLSDEDVIALVAYLRSQPSITNTPRVDTPSNHLNLIGYLITGSGLYHTAVQKPITQPVVGPPPSITPEYGNYLTAYIGCRDCHGKDFAGGVRGGLHPNGPNLTVIVPNWTGDQFISTIRTGVTPRGHTLKAEIMPWKEISSALSDYDLKAIYAYLDSLTPVTAKTK
jgi:cytochrome c553